MSIKTLNTVAGESIKTIATVPNESVKNVLGIPGASGDAFVSACQGQETLYALWTCQDVNIGDLATGAECMTDISGNGRPGIKAVVGSTGNWQIADSSAPGGHSFALTKYVSADVDDQGTANYAAVDSAITPISSELDLSSGFVIYYMPSFWQRMEIACYTGTDGSPVGSTGALLLNSYSDYLQAANSAGGGNTDFNPKTGGSTDTSGNTSRTCNPDADGPPATNCADHAGNWVFWGWRLPRHGTDEFKSFHYVQRIGSAWGTNQSAWLLEPQGMFATMRGGLRFGYGSNGTRPANTAWAAHAIFTGDIGADGLQAIYEAAGFVL
jgi:hypothetical protein